MNSALQCLLHCRPLCEYFLIQNRPGNTYRAFGELITKRYDQEGPANDDDDESYRNHRLPYAPRNILQCIQYNHSTFRGYHQQDAQEFIRCFLDSLHSDCRSPIFAYESRGNSSNFATDNFGNSTENHNHSDNADDSDSADSYRTAPDSGCSDTEPDESGGNSNAHVTAIPMTSAMRRLFGCVPGAYRSIVTDVFDGRIMSSVRCTTCQHVSTTLETFQVSF